jgi:TIR domain-containing protein
LPEGLTARFTELRGNDAGRIHTRRFLRHSSKDKPAVRELADRLKADGVRVWLDAWEIKPGDSIPAKIEDGLEHSRVLVLCMSANAFGSDWAQVEAGTFRFRDPLNKDRRFIPLRLDGADIKGSLAQFMYIDWRPSTGGFNSEAQRRGPISEAPGQAVD